MAKLIYVTNTSLDGFIEDQHGSFNFSEPADDRFVFTTELMGQVGTHLYGRRLYETMAVWETDPAFAAESELMAEFARIWQAADKIVYSTTLGEVSTGRSKLERAFVPETVRTMKESASRDLMVGGANIAAHAFAAGLVDEYHAFICPVILGEGKPALPNDLRTELTLLDERKLSNGVIYVRYGELALPGSGL